MYGLVLLVDEQYIRLFALVMIIMIYKLSMCVIVIYELHVHVIVIYKRSGDTIYLQKKNKKQEGRHLRRMQRLCRVPPCGTRQRLGLCCAPPRGTRQNPGLSHVPATLGPPQSAGHHRSNLQFAFICGGPKLAHCKVLPCSQQMAHNKGPFCRPILTVGNTRPSLCHIVKGAGTWQLNPKVITASSEDHTSQYSSIYT